jgi:hypothetical protein
VRRTKNGLPKHCTPVIDRHGKRRVRFRKRGFSAYLTGIPWSEDFMRQYAAALEGVQVRKALIGADRSAPNSLGALIKAYLDPNSTSLLKTRAPETQRTQRNILENFARDHGDKPIFRTDHNGRRTMLLTREHMQVIVNGKAATPFAQRNFLNTVTVMFQWAADEGRIPVNPALGVRRDKIKTTGYRTWSEAEIAQFEAKHPIGTKGRLALALLLYTGAQRRPTNSRIAAAARQAIARKSAVSSVTFFHRGSRHGSTVSSAKECPTALRKSASTVRCHLRSERRTRNPQASGCVRRGSSWRLAWDSAE